MASFARQGHGKHNMTLLNKEPLQWPVNDDYDAVFSVLSVPRLSVQ
jgi:hypothetical protein